MDVIIVGCGRVGSQLAGLMSREGHNTTIIDKNPSAFRRLDASYDGERVVGIGYDEGVLRKAGIEVCDYFVAVTNLDNTNLMAAEVARSIFGVAKVVARLDNPEHASTYEHLGIPYISGTTLLANELERRMLHGRRHLVDHHGRIEEVYFAVADSLVGHPVGEITRDGEILPTIIHRGERYFIPVASTRFEAGDMVRVCVDRDSLYKLNPFIKE